jgi:hypothetical protein
MSTSINNQQPSHSLYPIDELEPLLTHQSQTRTSTGTRVAKSPVLFTVKDGLKQIHHVISMDAELGRWKTQQGTNIDPQSDSLGYHYYQIQQEFMDCRRDIGLREFSSNEVIPMTIGFMNLRQLIRANDRLGNIQFMLILWTLALIVSVIISIVYAVKHHMF